MRAEDTNRATPDGFLEWMLRNPVYFRDLSGLDATRQNISQYFNKLRDASLVVAANVHSGPPCPICDVKREEP